MAAKHNAEQVEGLTLEPVGRSQTSMTESTTGSWGSRHFTRSRRRRLCVMDSNWYTTAKRPGMLDPARLYGSTGHG